MKIGLSMLFILGQPFPYLLRELRKVEVENIELVDDGSHALNSRRTRALKGIAEDRGLQMTVHAPFADVNPASSDHFLRRAALRRLKKSILLSSDLGAHLWTFHPGLQTGISHFYPGLDWNLNLESVRELLGLSQQCGVKIAIENTPDPFPFLLKNVNDFVRFYESLGNADLGLTLDVGHANISGQVYEFIESFPSRIAHAHLHDNLGDFDSHLGVGSGNIDWRKLINALRKIDYKGVLVVEAEKNVEESLEKLKMLLQSA